ncbi:MAG: hypothetical protein ACJ791_00485 [Gemmatimonadaceae bacterium]
MRVAVALFMVAIVGFIFRDDAANDVAVLRGSSLSVGFHATHYRPNASSAAAPIHKSLRTNSDLPDCASKLGIVSVRAVLM